MTWKAYRLVWTVAMALLPWTLVGFARLNWNVVQWNAEARGFVGGVGALLAAAAFTFPGYRFYAED